MGKNEVIRKRNPVSRKNIHVLTLKKVKDFLSEQLEPVFLSEIVKQIGVDYNSLKIAVEELKAKRDEQGRVYLKKSGKKNV